jgi:serine/threonine protein kinase
VHRDLTPNNILLESSDSERDFTVNVKLVDFGLAKQRPNATVQLPHVCLRSQCGTCCYT